MGDDDKMELMLDNSMPVDLNDVDDLFGEGVDLGMTSREPSRSLMIRLNELRHRGCLQGIAWSRSGTIASITPDEKSIEFRFLRCIPEDGSWQLGEPTIYEGATATGTARLTHLAWSATQSPELAVIDSFGRVTILTFSVCINQPYISRTWEEDPLDDLQKVVGCSWLAATPPSKQVGLSSPSHHVKVPRQYHVLHGPAVKTEKGYRYDSQFIHAHGPWHPTPSRSALVTISSTGVLKLFYSQRNNKVECTSIELENPQSSRQLLSHAAISSEKYKLQGILFVAYTTRSKLLAVSKVILDWNQPPPTTDKQPPGSTPLRPTLQGTHLACTSLLPEATTWSSNPSLAEISHLEILPSVLDTNGKKNDSPLILTVRSAGPTPSAPYQQPQSIIDRWRILLDQNQELPSAFAQLGNKRSTSAGDLEPETELEKLEPLIVNKLVIGVHTTHFGKVVCFSYSDGSVEHRDRFTMEELYKEVKLDKILTLDQLGFTFGEEATCLQTAVSPTNCSVVRIRDDRKVEWAPLKYRLDDIGDSNQDPQYAGLVAALTVIASAAIYYQTNYDDMLAVARPYATKKQFVYDWLSEIIKMLRMTVDYSEDNHHDSLVRNVPLQVCLSIFNSLGFRGQFKPRSFGSKFSTLALNARNVVILITIAMNSPIPVRERNGPLDEPEVVDTLTGCAKWCLDLLAWLCGSLFDLLDDPNFTSLLKPERFKEMAKYLRDRNDVALHLILCSSSRGFLTAVCRRVQHLENVSARAVEFYEKNGAAQGESNDRARADLHLSYRRLQRVTSSSLVNVKELEALLMKLGVDVRRQYEVTLGQMATQFASHAANQQTPIHGKQLDAQLKTVQMQNEINMLLVQPPPNFFLPVVFKFVLKDLRSFRARMDSWADIFFGNFDILEVSENEKTLEARRAKRKYVDIFKRTELTGPPPRPLRKPRGSPGGHDVGEDAGSAGPRLRQCTRCTAVMEDVSGQRPAFTFVLSQQRKCSCGGHWSLLPRGTPLF